MPRGGGGDALAPLARSRKRRGAHLHQPVRGSGAGAGRGRAAGLAAGLHDIGKVVIPDAILNKTVPLDDGEWEVIRLHPVFGFKILQGGSDRTVKVAAAVVLYHHEAWDGSGYPEGLAGEAIPHEARIVSICDVYHALREVSPTARQSLMTR